jgi:hypothetical protein
MTTRLLIFACVVCSARVVSAQSPELSLREFASGQIKKGVRSVGFGGDGATWGNYGLVYEGHDTALIDAGITGYTNGNIFTFTAVGITTPQLWHGLALYVLGLAQTTTLRDPTFGMMPLPSSGDGGDQLVALRVAMPLGRGFSIGVQLTYEVSQFDAFLIDGRGAIRYRTSWLPSGGFGVAWMPNKRWLIGTRVILNNDWEHRSDPVGTRSGWSRSYEYRLGVSASPWRGALIDVGGVLLDRANEIAGTEVLVAGANLGFEQAFLDRKLVIRGGVDECQLGIGSACSATAGLSFKGGPINVDLAYLYDLGLARIGTIFGAHSHSGLITVTLDYGWLWRHRKAP